MLLHGSGRVSVGSLSAQHQTSNATFNRHQAEGRHTRSILARAAVEEAAPSATDDKISAEKASIAAMLDKPYKHGWKSEILSETFAAGISEDVVRAISKKKVGGFRVNGTPPKGSANATVVSTFGSGAFPLYCLVCNGRLPYRQSAVCHAMPTHAQDEPDWMLQFRLRAYRQWLTMEEPKWSDNTYPTIDYQRVSYYSEPKIKEKKQSLDEVDPELLRTFDKLGIPLNEQKRLSNVAVDAVFDSVSIATTFRADLAKAGVIFCSISEAVKEYPDLVKKYMGSVVRGESRIL